MIQEKVINKLLSVYVSQNLTAIFETLGKKILLIFIIYKQAYGFYYVDFLFLKNRVLNESTDQIVFFL